jgi:hypothetical protein
VETGVKLLSKEPWTYARTRDAYSAEGAGRRACVGGFGSVGLDVDIDSLLVDFGNASGRDGLAVVRREV